MPQQVLVIHGGRVFKKYEDYLEFLKNYEINLDKIKSGGWKDHLQEILGNDYEVIRPQMENQHNAKYLEWKIFFERFFPHLQNGIILIGNSLGSLFLAKYLSENNFPVKIKAVFLLAGPFDEFRKQDIKKGYTLGDFTLPNSLENIERQAGKIFLYHSKDDPAVPFVDVEKYAAKLPKAEKVIFEDKGHFTLKEFPEIVEKIRSL